MASTALEQQISKLGHRLKDIRFRAIQSILLKLDSNLLSVDELCAVGVDVVRHCKKWLSDSENEAEFGSALRLLDTVCSAQNAECIEVMLQEHFPSFLHRFSMERQLGHHELQRAQSIISALISCPQYKERENSHGPDRLETSSPSPLLPAQHKVLGAEFLRSPPRSGSSASGFGSDPTSNGQPVCGRGHRRGGRLNSWRFPAVALIRGDVEHLFDLSLRLKVENESICGHALLQFEWLTIWHFPPEIVLQSDLHLLESLLLVLERRPLPEAAHLVTQCLQSLTVWTQRMAHSLRLRADPSTMSHPASKRAASRQLDEWRYPNDFSPAHSDPADCERFEARNAVQCTSISEMVQKVVGAAAKLLGHESTRFPALRLIQRMVDQFVAVQSPPAIDSQSVVDIVAAFGPYTDSLDLDALRVSADGDHDVFVHFTVQFIAKCLCLCPELSADGPRCLEFQAVADRIPSSTAALLTQYAVTRKLAMLYPAEHGQIQTILRRIDPATHRKLQYVDAVKTALATLKGTVSSIDSG